jgi:YD repeat-containing protein
MDFVDAGGRPMLARGGVARWRYELDAHGESVAAEGLDLEGQLVRRGLARTVWSRDDWGNLLRTAFFDAQGAPALDAGRGAATVAVRDDHGLLRALRLLDARGAPYLGSDGHAGYGFSYDAAGRRLALTYVDVAGRPTRAAGGFARATYRYDDRGRLVEERRYDEAGELVITPAGFAIAAHRYNDAGDEILTLFLGPHGGPMIGEGIASGIAQAYDAAHRLLGYAFLDERGKPRDIWRGYAVVRHAYDASGRRVRTERLDSGGEPAQVLDLRLLRVAFGVPGSRSRDDARARADEALRRVRRGLPFADALRQYGDGSEQPATVEISAGMLQPELAKAARALAPGEVSEVIETLQGFFVLQRAK